MDNYGRSGSQTRSSLPKSNSNSQMIPVTHSRESSMRRAAREGSMADGSNEVQHTENITTEDGSHLQVTRSVRALSNDPYGRHVRETRDKIGKDIVGHSDFQADSFTRDDGTKVRKTQMQSAMRWTSGNRPPVMQPSLHAHDPAVFFNDNFEPGNMTIVEQETDKALARAQSYLKYTGGVPYPKGFLPSPTFWHRPLLQTFGRSKNDSGVTVTFTKENSSEDRHSRSSFRSNSHTHTNPGEHRPSSLNSHISTTPEKESDRSNKLRSHSAFMQTGSSRNQLQQQRYNQLQSSSFISSSSTSNSQQKFRKSSLAGIDSMQPITEAKVPLITENLPPQFTYQIENVNVEKGGTAYFRGTVNGSYPFDTIWYLNNNELRSTNPNIETSIRRDYTETYLTGLIDYIISLKVHNCTQRDAGKYTAYIRNSAGSASSSAFLVVGGNYIMA